MLSQCGWYCTPQRENVLLFLFIKPIYIYNINIYTISLWYSFWFSFSAHCPSFSRSKFRALEKPSHFLEETVPQYQSHAPGRVPPQRGESRSETKRGEQGSGHKVLYPPPLKVTSLHKAGMLSASLGFAERWHWEEKRRSRWQSRDFSWAWHPA